MKHCTIAKFWKYYDALPQELQKAAKKQFELLKNNPNHPSLECKDIGHFKSARINDGYRALGKIDGDSIIWFCIVPHDEYMRILGRAKN